MHLFTNNNQLFKISNNEIKVKSRLHSSKWKKKAIQKIYLAFVLKALGIKSNKIIHKFLSRTKLQPENNVFTNMVAKDKKKALMFATEINFRLKEACEKYKP